MVDLIKVTTAFLIGYGVFMLLIMGLAKTFFPLFTKEEIEHQKKRLSHLKVNVRQVS